MSNEPTKVRLKISEDEMRDVLTEIWHKTGYDIDKKDPVIIEYVMHKIILEQFADQQGQVFQNFYNLYMPLFKAAGDSFEAKKTVFLEYAETTQKGVLKSLTDEYFKTINSSLNKIMKNLQEHLESLLTRQRKQEDEWLAATREEHKRFEDTAEWFGKNMNLAALAFGGAVVVAAAIIVGYWHWIQ